MENSLLRKGIIYCLLLANPVFSFCQETNFTIQQLDTTGIDLYSPAPGRGINNWYGNKMINIPDPQRSRDALDNNTRFSWIDFQTVKDRYDFSVLDKELRLCIYKKQKLSFGIQSILPGAPPGAGLTVEKANMQYPLYLHEQMQLDIDKDYKVPSAFTQSETSIWVPNWNNAHFQEEWKKLLLALAKHIEKDSLQTVPIKNLIYYIEIRGYGAWGEWHQLNNGTGAWNGFKEIPRNAVPTIYSLTSLIDSYRDAFPDIQLIAIVNGFYTGEGFIPPDVAHHLLTARNNRGLFGWRSDHLGAEYNLYNQSYNIRNAAIVKGDSLSKLIMERWKFAPITGETINDYASTSMNGKQCALFNLINEVNTFHISQFSNEQLTGHKDKCIDENYRKAAKAAGYRISIIAGALPSEIKVGETIDIKTVWTNTGNAPTYENWQTLYLWRDKSAKTIFISKAAFIPTLFLPGTAKFTDKIKIPADIPAGLYTISVVIKDPTGYRDPLPIAITGRMTDGSYQLATIQLVK